MSADTKSITLITTMTWEEANKVIELNEHRDKLDSKVYLYGCIGNTPIRPRFSTWTITKRAMVMPDLLQLEQVLLKLVV